MVSLFYKLLEAGLWERDIDNVGIGGANLKRVYRMAEEQSVVGLIAAGLEHVRDIEITGDMIPLEMSVSRTVRRNLMLNQAVCSLTAKMRAAVIFAFLVKGQGIAQCYSRPLWRSAGDIDFLLDADGYTKAKALLEPLAESIETEYSYLLHEGMRVDGCDIELHGTLRSRLSRRIDDELDRIQGECFRQRRCRVWDNDGTEVLLPAPDDDVIFVFTHILHHFFIGGIGLRQICDWCRLLWTYRDVIDLPLLARRLGAMRIMSEWRTFAAFAVNYLGMTPEVMPLYDNGPKWRRKARRISGFVLEVGNFGHNRKTPASGRQPYLIRKAVTFFWFRIPDLCRHFVIFPADAVRFAVHVSRTGLHAVMRGE